ncbi:MAG TPA: DUF4124 domain-containing protein [Telluria sp.]|jgi:hypothetical protein
MITKPLALLFGCALASGALAQQMYKVIGADGKVTYSDRPALEKANKMSVMKSYTLRPVEEVKKKDPGPPPPVVDPNATITPEVEEAMISIMTTTQLTIQTLPICSPTQEAGHAFAGATANWKKRNAAYIEQSKRLLMEVMSPHKRADMLEKAAGGVGDVAKAIPVTAQGRRDWCAGAVAELDSGRIDINKPVMLSIPITKYRAK